MPAMTNRLREIPVVCKPQDMWRRSVQPYGGWVRRDDEEQLSEHAQINSRKIKAGRHRL